MELTEALEVSPGEQTTNVHSTTGKYTAGAPGWEGRLIDRDDQTGIFWGKGLEGREGTSGTERKSGRPEC